jgi:acetyltransferase-like isoleucine patch superfamily enzyme
MVPLLDSAWIKMEKSDHHLRIDSMFLSKLQRRWGWFWMKFAGLSRIGRTAVWCATLFAPPYKSRTYLAHITKNSYISPNASIFHKDLELARNVFIGERVVIYQAQNGGAVKIGERTHLHQEIIIETGDGGGLVIGNDSHIQPRCQFSAYKGSITIGSNVQIAPFCAFYPYNHGFESSKTIMEQSLFTKGGIIIDDDAWIGVGSIVLDGVRIGKGAVVGAGAVVSDDIPDGSIAAGVPARVVKMRKDFSQ